MKIIKIVSILLLISLSECHAQKPDSIRATLNPEKWQLEWHDEFNTGEKPDKKNWSYECGLVRNKESQYYTSGRLKNACVDNGHLVITAIKEDYLNAAYQPGSSNWQEGDRWAHYTSACLTTQGKRDFLYGRIEVRAKLPEGKGSWPAIWLVGTRNASWPEKGEIDMMEHVGFDTLNIYGTTHALSLDPNAYRHKVSKGDTIKVSADIFQNYHIYAIEWYKDRIDFYFDNTKYFSYVVKDYNILQGTFNKPFYMLLNSAVGGTWGGRKGIDNKSFPQHFYIDYVRYFKQKGNEQ